MRRKAAAAPVHPLADIAARGAPVDYVEVRLRPLAKVEALVIDVKEAAALLGTSPANVYQMLQRHQIPSAVLHKGGTGRKFVRSKLIAWIEGEEAKSKR